MLQNLPAGIGRALHSVRPGLDALTSAQPAAREAPAAIAVTSPAFAEGGAIPARYTADGEGLSPPLAWSGVPAGTGALVLLVEDADSPTPSPLVHAVALDLPPADGALAEGELPGPATEGPETAHEMGKNSFLRAEYLPMDPPPGHGAHRYAFQLFALRDMPEALHGTPGRGAVREALAGRVLATGRLIGTYERT